MKKNKTQKPNPVKWDHKIFRVYSDGPHFDDLTIDMDSDRVDHVYIDDMQDEYEELNLEGWRFITGFALDDESFYLMYKRPEKKL